MQQSEGRIRFVARWVKWSGIIMTVMTIVLGAIMVFGVFQLLYRLDTGTWIVPQPDRYLMPIYVGIAILVISGAKYTHYSNELWSETRLLEHQIAAITELLKAIKDADLPVLVEGRVLHEILVGKVVAAVSIFSQKIGENHLELPQEIRSLVTVVIQPTVTQSDLSDLADRLDALAVLINMRKEQKQRYLRDILKRVPLVSV